MLPQSPLTDDELASVRPEQASGLGGPWRAPVLAQAEASCKASIDGIERAWLITVMSDRVKLAREIAARTKPRFIDTNPPERPQTLKECKVLARTIAARSEPRFIAIEPKRGGAKVHFTDEQLSAMRGGLTVEQYRRKTIRKWEKR
jgi:hypothetical protein